MQKCTPNLKKGSEKLSYSNLKAKIQKKIDIFSYENKNANFIVSMFETNGENPFTTGKWDRCEFENLLLSSGKLAIWENDGELIFSEVTFIGNIDFMGIGKDANCITFNGISKTFENWRENPNVVIVYNNENHTPDYNIERFANIMAETWVSMKCAIIGTRYSKALGVSNEQERNSVESAIASNNDGKPLVLMSNNLFPEEKNIDSIRLTDFSESDKIQYLSTYMSWLERNFINQYGMASQGGDKVAQQNEAEIMNGAFSSWVEVLSRLNERKKGFEKVKERFGVDISYDLSEVWKKEYKRLFSEVENRSEERVDVSQDVERSEESEQTNKEDVETDDKKEGSIDDE